jgi:hypothetical protein
MFRVNNLRPYPTAKLRPSVPVATLWDEDDEYDFDRISAAEIDNVQERRGKYLLFYTHFQDEHIPHVWHHFNEVQCTFAL